MLNSNTLNWNQVKADFGDTNSAMNTAIGGFSKAGDVFTKMRDRLAAEEQLEAENAFKQAQLDESIRATDIADANADADREQRAKDAAERNKIAASANSLGWAKHNQMLEDRKKMANIYDRINRAYDAGYALDQNTKEINTLGAREKSTDNPLTPDEVERLATARGKQEQLETDYIEFSGNFDPKLYMSSTGRRELARQMFAAAGLDPNLATLYDLDAKREQDLSDASTEAKKAILKESRTELSSSLDSAGFLPETKNAIMEKFDKLSKLYDPREMAHMLGSINPSDLPWLWSPLGKINKLDPEDVSGIVDDMLKAYLANKQNGSTTLPVDPRKLPPAPDPELFPEIPYVPHTEEGDIDVESIIHDFMTEREKVSPSAKASAKAQTQLLGMGPFMWTQLNPEWYKGSSDNTSEIITKLLQQMGGNYSPQHITWNNIE